MYHSAMPIVELMNTNNFTIMTSVPIQNSEALW
jgi:hypothetical protein